MPRRERDRELARRRKRREKRRKLRAKGLLASPPSNLKGSDEKRLEKVEKRGDSQETIEKTPEGNGVFKG